MIIEQISKIAKLYPNKIAFKNDNESITYSELFNKIELYSKKLSMEGSSPVVIYSDDKFNSLIIMLSCIMAKRAYVPIGLCTPVDRLKRIIDATNASLIITDQDIDINNIDVISFSKIDKMDGSFDGTNDNEIAYIIFTSGSTGEPKGVPISYNNLYNFIKWISNLYPLNTFKDSNVLNQASFSFDLSVADIYYSLCNGHSLIISNGYDDIYKTMRDDKVNIAVLTPTFMKLCLTDVDFNYQNYPNFKCVYFCGELLEVKLVNKILERFPNLYIINAYGPTEATSAVCGILIEKDMLNQDLLPVGTINDSATKIVIEDEEVVLKGDSVFSGYLNIKTDSYYKEHNINCYKTGDIGYIEDNKLYVKGRKDQQIKYKGYRIELGDIEYNISKINGVKDCAVIAKYDDNNNVKTIKAYVVIDDLKIDSDYIRNSLAERIPIYMVPKTISIVDSLPINKNGKIDRKALSAL